MEREATSNQTSSLSFFGDEDGVFSSSTSDDVNNDLRRASTQAQPADLKAEPDAIENNKTSEQGEGDTTLATEEEDASKDDTKIKSRQERLDRRFSELTQRQKEAQRLAEAERARAEQLEAELAQYRQNTAEPKYQDYEDPQAFAEDLANHRAKKAAAEAENRIRAEAHQRQQQELAILWQQKLELAKAHLPDFDAVVQSATAEVSDEIKEAILTSEIGPELLYTLADDDTLVAKLNRLPTTSALRELGKIEAGIVNRQDKKVVKAPSAPEPINPLKQSNVIKHTNMPSGDIHLDYLDEYRSLRRAGKIR